MPDPFLGEIRMFGGNFAPTGWALCEGQLLSIAQNTALFSLLGTTYGGNGQTTFALPDLRGRVPIHQGQGAGFSLRSLGETGGSESVSLASPAVPPHNHPLLATVGAADTVNPNGAGFALAEKPVYGAASGLAPAGPTMVGVAGEGSPHENRQPYLSLTFIIALEGVYPSFG